MADIYRTGVRQMLACLSRIRRPRPVNLAIDVPEDSRPGKFCEWSIDDQRAFMRRLTRRRSKKGYKVRRQGKKGWS
jgi:hypothetical protein